MKPTRAKEAAEQAEPIDQVLRSYFQAELPAPWPKLRLPANSSTPESRRAHAFTSRFALAATIALFVAGHWSLHHWLTSGQPSAPTQVNSPGLADRDHNSRVIAEEKSLEKLTLPEPKIVVDPEEGAALRLDVP